MFLSVGFDLKLQPAADVPLRGRQHRDRHPYPQRLLLPHLLVRPRVVHRRLPLPAQPRQTGPAGVRKSQVDIISSARKLHRLHISHYHLIALTTKPIIYIVRSSLSSLLSSSLLYFFSR